MSSLHVSAILKTVGLKRSLKAVLRRVNFVRKVSIHDTTFITPVIYGVRFRQSETWMSEVLTHIFPHISGVFVDVGVNVGQTLLKVRSLDKNRPYIGFEPNPTCVSYVQNLISLNTIRNVKLIPAGVFTEDTILSLNLYSDSGASVVNNFRQNKVYEQIFVPVFRPDSLPHIFPEEKTGIIKIDVEGAELEVIKGFSKIIERDRPSFVVEILPCYSESETTRLKRQQEIVAFFKKRTYLLCRIEKNPDGPFRGFKKLDDIEIHSDISLCD
jgi:FkbM family methyltransferase